MQAFSVWSVKGVCLDGLHLELGQNSSYVSRKKRINKKNWDFSKIFSRYGRPNSRGLNFSSGICYSSPNFNFQSGVLFNPSKLNFGINASVTWALEQENIGNEFSKNVSNLKDGLSVDKSDSSEDDCINILEEKDSGTVITEDNENPQKGSGVAEEKRVDVRELAGKLRFAKTADDIEEVLQDMQELPLQVYSSLLRGFGGDKKMDPAMALFEWLKMKKKATNGRIGPNLFIYNSLLGAMKQCKRFREVKEITEEMAEEGVFPNIVTYNTLMAIYLEQGHPDRAIAFLDKMENKGLSPSPITYSIALGAYRSMEDASGALKLFVEVRDKYQKGEIGKDDDGDWEIEFVRLENYTIRICYQVMRRWLVVGGHLSNNVLKLLVEMDTAGLKLGRSECERLAWACTVEDHYIVAKELYNRIREGDSEISLSVCNHIIWVMGKAKKWWAALEIYEDLLEKGPTPNNLSYELVVSHFNILLTAASRRGIWRWGVRLLNKMEEKGLKPRSREWNAVLVACSKAAETAAAVQIFKRMVEQGEKPTILSYGALLSALEKGKLYDEALQVWEHMIKLGVKPNLYAYTILASIHVGLGNSEKVESVITEMIDSKIEPTVVTYNAIISGFANHGKGSSAFEWFNRMKDKNVTPNSVTYDMLILGLARDAKPIIAYEMYLRANNEGLQLSSKAYDAVICSAKTFGATIDAIGLGPRPPEKKKKIKARKDLTEFSNLADVSRRSKPFDKEELFFQPSQ